MTQSDLANIIRAIIKRKGLIQRAVAECAGFSEQQFSDMLYGRKVIRAEFVPGVAKALGVKVAELYGAGWEESGKDGSRVTNILSASYTKITVLDIETDKEIAVITNELITTARDSVVVKLTPSYN